MIGIIVVTHRELGQAFVASAEHILGKVDAICAVAIDANDNHEAALRRIRDAVAGLHAEDGVLVLTDMFGGTPSNVCLSLLEPNRTEVVSGVNMPMLLHAITTRLQGGSLAALAKSTAASGRKNVINAGALLGEDEAVPQ